MNNKEILYKYIEGFKNGAFKYYLGKYQANVLLNYIEQLEDIIKQKDNAIDECIKFIQEHAKVYDNGLQCEIYDYDVQKLLEKLQKAKGDNDGSNKI